MLAVPASWPDVPTALDTVRRDRATEWPRPPNEPGGPSVDRPNEHAPTLVDLEPDLAQRVPDSESPGQAHELRAEEAPGSPAGAEVESVDRDRAEADSHEAPTHAPELPGYRILSALGRGGMAEVWLAEKEGTAGVPFRCVVKTILPDLVEQEGFRERFLDEARIVSSLRHPNITSVLDVGRAGEHLYLTMEWCDGVDASRLLKRVRARGVHVPLRHCIHILREVLQGLHHAHTATGADGRVLSVVHRDISPANVLIGRAGSVKLADFGVARAVHSQRVERRGLAAGKAHYFAPELFRGAQASAVTDLFAVGVVMYELCTLQPFVDRRLTLPEVRDRILAFREESVVDADLSLPDGIEPIFLRALAVDPARRYPTALAFLEDLNDYVYESGMRLLDAHLGEWVRRTLDAEGPEGRRPLLAGVTR